MIVDIEKIIVKDRIRKDLGDIQELANDIKENGLINPPVVNKEYHLLAGERRLTACKSLGWNQVEVRMMDTKDAEHELEIEISENEVRKDFSRAERVEYARKLERIESVKAGQRMADSGGNISTPLGKTRDIVAEKMNIGSGKQYEKEKSIVDNKNLLSAEDFADWDEGRLSTNKAFQKIKKQQERIEDENERLRRIVSEKEAENVRLKNQKVEVREVEVIPDDYEELKKKVEISKKDYASLHKQYDRMTDKWKQSESEKRELLDKMNRPEEQQKINTKNDCIFLVSGIRRFISDNEQYKYLKDDANTLPEEEQRAYIKAVSSIREWAEEMLGEITVTA